MAALRQAEAKAAPGSTAVTEAVARNLFKLMAIKDEYEVARLYTDGSFARSWHKQFQSYDELEFHLAPPIMGRRGNDGKPQEIELRPVDDEGLSPAGGAQRPARHCLRPVRLQRRAAHGAAPSGPV